jgi:NAD(P)H-hydrate epimerase
MKYLVTAQEMRGYDSNTIKQIGIPGMVLMERAALAARDRVTAVLRGECGGKRDSCNGASVLILAGMGNNGGDGLALARLLSEAGFRVEVWCVGDERKASEQWLSQRKILEHDFANFSDSPTSREYTILVDALFGVGLSRKVEGDYASAIRQFNELRGYKLALDVPSGICSDTGRVLGIAVKADETVTFGFAKRGLYLYPGCEYAGRVQTADVGINAKSFLGETPGMFYLDEIRDFLPPRQRSGNKGTFGKVLLIAGSAGMAGAAVLSAKSAYRTGAGMVKVVTAPENRVILQETVPEVLF